MTHDDAAYRAAELRLHEAALECANAVYDKKGLRTVDLLDAVMHYAMVVGRKPHDHTALGCATTDHDCPDMSCPHCPCTYTTECCHCDGTRTPLEDE